jgi:hypothetical protein
MWHDRAIAYASYLYYWEVIRSLVPVSIAPSFRMDIMNVQTYILGYSPVTPKYTLSRTILLPYTYYSNASHILSHRIVYDLITLITPLYRRGKSPRYPFDRRLGEPQSQSRLCGEEKILDPTVTRTLTLPSSSP